MRVMSVLFESRLKQDLPTYLRLLNQGPQLPPAVVDDSLDFQNEDAGEWPELPPDLLDDDGLSRGLRQHQNENEDAADPVSDVRYLFRAPGRHGVVPGSQLLLELFSQPRTTAMARKMGQRADFAFDVVYNAWNALLASDREAVKQFLIAVRPKLTVLSPPCTMFSALMRRGLGDLLKWV